MARWSRGLSALILTSWICVLLAIANTSASAPKNQKWKPAKEADQRQRSSPTVQGSIVLHPSVVSPIRVYDANYYQRRAEREAYYLELYVTRFFDFIRRHLYILFVGLTAIATAVLAYMAIFQIGAMRQQAKSAAKAADAAAQSATVATRHLEMAQRAHLTIENLEFADEWASRATFDLVKTGEQPATRVL